MSSLSLSCRPCTPKTSRKMPFLAIQQLSQLIGKKENHCDHLIVNPNITAQKLPSAKYISK